MALNDSTKKIIGYLESAGLEQLVLSKMFFRDYSCPAGCGGCCPKFSLDYQEGERWEKFKELYPEQVERFEKREVNGMTFYSDMQKDNPGLKCRNLTKEGRCAIHKANPFSCEFELMRFVTKPKENKAYLMNKLFGRGWNMMRVDGERGALCEMLPFNYDKLVRDIELLEELRDIGDKMGIENKLDRVIKFLRNNMSSWKAGLIPTDNVSFKDDSNSNQLKLI